MSINKGSIKTLSISSAGLMEAIRTLVMFHEPLSRINEHFCAWRELACHAQELEAYPDLMHALTDLHTQSQMDFERGLFCAWISYIVARKLGYEEHTCRQLFIAGLSQDIGNYLQGVNIQNYLKHSVLSIDGGASRTPAGSAVNEAEPTSVDQGSQAFVSVSYFEHVFTEETQISNMILTHHACEDGSGYPKGVNESQLTVTQQILIVANQLCDQMAMCSGYSSLDNCLPYLKVASVLYFKQVNGAFYDLINTSCVAMGALRSSERNSQRYKTQIHALTHLHNAALHFSAEVLTQDSLIYVSQLREKIRKLDIFVNETGVQGFNADSHECPVDLLDFLEAFQPFLKTWLPLLDDLKREVDAASIQSLERFELNLRASIKSLEKPRAYSLFV